MPGLRGLDRGGGRVSHGRPQRTTGALRRRSSSPAHRRRRGPLHAAAHDDHPGDASRGHRWTVRAHLALVVVIAPGGHRRALGYGYAVERRPGAGRRHPTAWASRPGSGPGEIDETLAAGDRAGRRGRRSARIAAALDRPDACSLVAAGDGRVRGPRDDRARQPPPDRSAARPATGRPRSTPARTRAPTGSVTSLATRDAVVGGPPTTPSRAGRRSSSRARSRRRHGPRTAGTAAGPPRRLPGRRAVAVSARRRLASPWRACPAGRGGHRRRRPRRPGGSSRRPTPGWPGPGDTAFAGASRHRSVGRRGRRAPRRRVGGRRDAAPGGSTRRSTTRR